MFGDYGLSGGIRLLPDRDGSVSANAAVDMIQREGRWCRVD